VGAGRVELVRCCEARGPVGWSRRKIVQYGMAQGHLRTRAGLGCSSVVQHVLNDFLVIPSTKK
jgi:hypothetical protein